MHVLTCPYGHSYYLMEENGLIFLKDGNNVFPSQSTCPICASKPKLEVGRQSYFLVNKDDKEVMLSHILPVKPIGSN